jgi:hypothetical protein
VPTIRKAGPFANDGERRVVEELRRKLPPNAIIISNLYLPHQRDTLEVDVVVVAAFGVTLIEVKDWRGEVRFERGACLRGDDRLPDPRPLISLKAKVMQSAIAASRPVAGVKIATNPLVIFASDSTRVSGDIDQSVRVKRLTEGVVAVGQGRVVEHGQGCALGDREIVAVADAIFAQHDPAHRLRVGSYLLGDRIAGSLFEEYWGTETGETDHKVRLKRHRIDDLAVESERNDQIRQAHRDVVALRKLERLRHRALPIVYATFVDPDDDTSIWTCPSARRPSVDATAVLANRAASPGWASGTSELKLTPA